MTARAWMFAAASRGLGHDEDKEEGGRMKAEQDRTAIFKVVIQR